MTSVTIVRTIEAPPEAVFAAFVQPDKIALWWGPDDGPVLSAEIEARVGGRFHIRFRLAEDGSEHGSSGTLGVRPAETSRDELGVGRQSVPSRVSTSPFGP